MSFNSNYSIYFDKFNKTNIPQREHTENKCMQATRFESLRVIVADIAVSREIYCNIPIKTYLSHKTIFVNLYGDIAFSKIWPIQV